MRGVIAASAASGDIVIRVGSMSTMTGTAPRLVTARAVNAAVIAGTITGIGNLNKAGAGALNLTGNNTYSGTTFVNAGTLGIYNPTAVGSGSITAAGGTTLTFGRGLTRFDSDIVMNGNVTFDLDTSVDYLVVGGGGGADVHSGVRLRHDLPILAPGRPGWSPFHARRPTRRQSLPGRRAVWCAAEAGW